MLAVEGGSALNGQLSRIRELACKGVWLATLTWNGKNELGCGVRCKEDTGLTAFGVAAVAEMQRVGMTVDVSHLSDRGFWQVAEITTQPFIASHSNARAICPNKRNLTDDQFKAIVARSGLVGLNFYPAFLTERKPARLADILPHLEHFLSLGGENTVALGSDFDGAPMPVDLPDMAALPTLWDFLSRKNYAASLLEKLFFGNAVAFFGRA